MSNNHSDPSIGMWDNDGFCTGNTEYDTRMMTAPTDIDMEDDDNHQITSTIPVDIEINENVSKIAKTETTKNPIKITKIQPSLDTTQSYYKDQDFGDEDDGIPAPIVAAK